MLALMPLLACFSLLGCQPEEKITRHPRPRVNDMKRMLALMVLPEKPKEQKTWVFKLVGAESAVDPLVETFDEFAKSVKIASDAPTWTLPQGWTAAKDNDGKRFATIHTGQKGAAPEIAVSAVEGEQAASIPAANVNRWRVQLGWKLPLGADEAMDFCRVIDVDGRAVVVVDMIGPGAPTTPAMKDAPRKQPGPAAPPFKYRAPPEWQKAPPNEFAALAFQAGDQAKKVDITVSILKGQGGGLLANINRWRGQVKLEDWAPAQLEGLAEVSIGAAKGKLVDMTGPKAPPQRNRIIGAILFRPDDALFFKMIGPEDLVGKQRASFETFLESVKFGD
jgi:hypothetical protein